MFYSDTFLNEKVISPLVLTPETGTEVCRFNGLEETEQGIYINVSWRGFKNSDKTLEPIKKAYEYVTHVVLKLRKLQLPCRTNQIEGS